MEAPRHYFTQNLYVIEGMDMVGKTTFLKEVMPEYDVYHCRHDITDATGHRPDAWIIGYGVVDFLEQMNDKTKRVVIDRGIFSSYVYERLYNNHYIDPQIIEWYKNNEFFKESIGHIYIRHHDAGTAVEIFNRAQSREKNPNEISNKYDQFNSFNDYWLYYNMADQLYRGVYQLIGVKPRIFETMPNMTWVERFS